MTKTESFDPTPDPEFKEDWDHLRFLRDNPNNRHKGVELIAFSPEQIESNRIESENRENHGLEGEVGGKAITESASSNSPIKRTRGV
jgi:hypothetical protein